MRNDWYTDFFSGLMVDFWEKALPAEQTQAEVKFLHDVFGLPPGRRLLDVPCGHGRHAIALAKLGYQMTGIDLSQDCLARARQSGGERVEWRRSDMRDLPWRAEFDGAFCCGNSFGYMDRSGMRAFAAAVSQTLKPGARFVLETGAAAESLLPALQERRWMELGDLLFFSRGQYDCAKSRLDTTYSVVKGGVRETKTAHTWIFTVAEIREMLSTEGLETEAIYGSVAKEAYGLGSARLVLVAQKGGG